MSKIGRYSADRKKIESISTTAGKTVTVADCGTVFSVSAQCTLDLPTSADAGAGWWCKVVNVSVGDDAAAMQVKVDLHSETTTPVGVEMSQTAVAITGSVFLSGSVGTQAEFLCDGTRYIVLAHGVAAGSVDHW